MVPLSWLFSPRVVFEFASRKKIEGVLGAAEKIFFWALTRGDKRMILNVVFVRGGDVCFEILGCRRLFNVPLSNLIKWLRLSWLFPPSRVRVCFSQGNRRLFLGAAEKIFFWALTRGDKRRIKTFVFVRGVVGFEIFVVVSMRLKVAVSKSLKETVHNRLSTKHLFFFFPLPGVRG
ncbi:hypothetical protein CEXT_509881 [Caerostris extrusa]|uniref:Uncharacterized protein n=1 Tax=Caerostris extrusa TaxID=172846 RepID=A0AAV4NH97_CAEEX|nr:hypothetical protein CEXT_509881 [Caerostris extrusa]